MQTKPSEGVPQFPLVITKRNGRATIYREVGRKAGREYVAFRLGFYATDGRRRFQCFATLEAATKAAHARLDALARGLVDVQALSGPDLLDYREARRLLPPGVTLTDAVRAYSNRPRVTPITVPDLVAAFVAAKTAATRSGRPASAKYADDLAHRLGGFATAFQMPVDGVTAGLITEWLEAAGQRGVNRFNTLRIIRTLLRWSQKRGHLPPGPLATDQLDIVHVDTTPVEIFTPAELERLLRAARPGLVPYLAIAAFAGLRAAEIERLDWREVNLARGFVEVTAAKAKVASRRLVPIGPALREWLAPYAKEGGPVVSYSHVPSRLADLAATTRISWKHNGLRHAFISYRLAQTQDAAKTALEAGNSPAMIFRHYRELVTEADAEAWFGVRPNAPSNVVNLPALAA